MSVLLKLRHKALSTLAGHAASIQEVSESSDELCPAERQVAPPAIYLPRDLERVTGVMDDTTLEQELRRVRGGERLHAATIAYHLSEVEWTDGFLFKGGWKDRLLETPSSKGTKERIAQGTLTGTFYGARYFGHWMTDDLTLGMAAETAGDPVVPERTPYRQEEGYLQLFGLAPRKVSSARLERLTVLEDIGQNSYKRQRYIEMRRRLRTAVPTPPAGRRVMLHRGGSGASRKLQNEGEIEEFLERAGFSVLDPARLSAEELAGQCAGAEIVVSVEGSQLVHGFYAMADSGVLCALQPPYRFNNIFKDQADCLGFKYAFLTGVAVEGGFRIELDEVRELLDRITKLAAT